MTDILITTPKKEIKNAAAEAEHCIKHGGGWYLRRMTQVPKDLKAGERVFYVENGFIRGYCKLYGFVVNPECTILSEGKEVKAEPGTYLCMRAETWEWIRPIPYKGFQGFRYFPQELLEKVEVIGDWLDPMTDPILCECCTG